MNLTRPLLIEKAEEYTAEEPLYPVEEEAIEMYPAAFASKDFGFRDAEWVVQWYYRRFLGEYPDKEQRVGEEEFGENERSVVRETVADAANETELETRIVRLRELEGVDLEVASAFLQFIDPERYLVIDGRTWGVLQEAGELGESYPNPLSIEEYREFLGASRRLGEECNVDLWTLYCALWRLARSEG